MVESVLDLHKPVNEALRMVGKFELCIDSDEINLLVELREFLCNFKELTLLVSECNPNLSLLPLLKTRVLKACEPRRSHEGQFTIDSGPIKRLKTLVRDSVDKRIKINDIVKLVSSFDPGVRSAHVVLSRDECRNILLVAHEKLRSEDSPVRSLFVEVNHTPLTDFATDEVDDGATSAKKMRLSLIQVSYSVTYISCDAHCFMPQWITAFFQWRGQEL